MRKELEYKQYCKCLNCGNIKLCTQSTNNIDDYNRQKSSSRIYVNCYACPPTKENSQDRYYQVLGM